VCPWVTRRHINPCACTSAGRSVRNCVTLQHSTIEGGASSAAGLCPLAGRLAWTRPQPITMGVLGFTIPDSNKGSKFGVCREKLQKNDRRKHHSCPYSVVYYGEVWSRGSRLTQVHLEKWLLKWNVWMCVLCKL